MRLSTLEFTDLIEFTPIFYKNITFYAQTFQNVHKIEKEDNKLLEFRI